MLHFCCRNYKTFAIDWAFPFQRKTKKEDSKNQSYSYHERKHFATKEKTRNAESYFRGSTIRCLINVPRFVIFRFSSIIRSQDLIMIPHLLILRKMKSFTKFLLYFLSLLVLLFLKGYPLNEGTPTPTIIHSLALEKQDMSPLACSCGEDHGLTTAIDTLPSMVINYYG